MRGKKGVLPRYRPGPSLSSRPGHGLAWSRTASAYLGQALPLLPQLRTGYTTKAQPFKFQLRGPGGGGCFWPTV